MGHVESMKNEFIYILHQCLQRVGVQRLSVAGLPDRKLLQAVKMHVNVSIPNLFVFLDHLRTMSIDYKLFVTV